MTSAIQLFLKRVLQHGVSNPFGIKRSTRRNLSIACGMAAEVSTCEPRILLSADVDPANDTAAGAVQLSAAQSSTVVDGTLGMVDIVDWYRFVLTSPRETVVSLTGLTENANLKLQQADGTVVAAGNRPGTRSEFIEATLPAGEYFIRVNAAVSTTDVAYQLTTNFAVPTTGVSGEPLNNTIPGARVIPTTGPQAIMSVIASGDPVDWYQFTLTEAQTVAASLTGLEANVDLELWTPDGTVLASSANAGSADETITEDLEAGTYLLRVLPAPGVVTPYLLTFNSDVAFANEPANDTRAGATVIDVNEPSKIKSSITSGDPVDWYRFDIVDDTDVTLMLDKTRRNLELYLTNSAGTTIASSTEELTESETITDSLTAGTYFIRIVRHAGGRITTDTPYRLRTSFIGPLIGEPANDFVSGAQSVVASTSGTVVTSALTVGDRVDWYSVEVDAVTSLRAALDSFTEDLTLAVYRKLGGNLIRLGLSRNVDLNAESVDFTVGPGEYYIRVVRGGSLTTETDYTLTVTDIT